MSIDPINIELLSQNSPAYVRVIDEHSIFAYGTDWSLLIHKGFDPQLVAALISEQNTQATVFHVGVLSTNINNVIMGISNNTFKPNGSMTSQTLKYQDEAWVQYYDQALQQVHYTTRPGSYVGLSMLAGQGHSRAIYEGEKKDSRRFAETGVPVPQRVEYVIEQQKQTIIFAVNGALQRFADNMGIPLSIPTTGDTSSETLSRPSDIVPWVLGRSEGSWMLIKPVTNKNAECLRNLHTNAYVACWGTPELAFDLLRASKTIYRNFDTVSDLFSFDVLCEEDLRVEIKNLRIKNYFNEFSPELFAIDILRYHGWMNEEIQAFMSRSYQDAWRYQARHIVEVFDAAATGEPEANAYVKGHGGEDIAFLMKIAQMEPNDEIQSILAHLETYSSWISELLEDVNPSTVIWGNQW